MDIYQALRNDHQEVKQLFVELEQPPHLNGTSRNAIFAKLKAALIAHGEAEEQVFYMELRRHHSLHSNVEQAIEDHDHVARTLEDLESMDMNSSTWLNKLMHFYDDVQHHILGEEEEIFQNARNIFSDQEAKDMAKQFEKAKAVIPIPMSC